MLQFSVLLFTVNNTFILCTVHCHPLCTVHYLSLYSVLLHPVNSTVLVRCIVLHRTAFALYSLLVFPVHRTVILIYSIV